MPQPREPAGHPMGFTQRDFNRAGMQVTIEVPRHHKQPQQCQPVILNVLLVEEAISRTQGTPIRWLLLTTLPIDTFEQAWQCVQWYSLSENPLARTWGIAPFTRRNNSL
jgi:hypothetical protein